MITVAKASLALSLGLVGALSIIRFRSPIKDPEELAYLFLAIAVGLGLGANQFLPTILASALILIFTGLVKWHGSSQNSRAMYLSVDISNAGPNFKIEDLNKRMLNYVDELNLRKFDTQADTFSCVYFIRTNTPDKLVEMNQGLKKIFPQVQLTFIDQNQMPSI